MNKEKFIEELSKIGVKLTKQQLENLECYYNCLTQYNAHTNLTAITNKEDVYLKHFYDSLTLVKVVKLDNQELIDVGTGAGFPGLVLKIVFPNLKVTLLDSNNKKITFLKEMVTRLNLQDINIVNSRCEDFAKTHFGKYDICVTRAVAFVDIITSLTLPLIKEEGKVILMKGNFLNEKLLLDQHQDELGVRTYNIVNFTLPIIDSERNLVVLQRKENIKIFDYSNILKRNKKWTNK